MITSTSNTQVKQLIQLQKKSKVRNEQKVFIVEGIRMFQEVPREMVKKVYISESLYNRKRQDLNLAGLSVELMSDIVFSRVSDTQTPQGILCVVEQMKYCVEDLWKVDAPHLVFLDNLQDPGNLGTILRTAEGAGVTGVVMSKDCVDIYNPKTIRSTMGSIYRLPFLYAEHLETVICQVKEKGVTVYAGHLDGRLSYDQEDYTKGTAFLIGNEGNGLREDIAQLADTWIRIPMCGEVESLNAAIAASILMFEVYRQRR